MTTTRKIEEELDLDDGPVLTTERLLPASPPPSARTSPPPPPPPGRRARGTAPHGEPLTSGLIDVREMAAAYAAERSAGEVPAPAFAEGTSPLPLLSLAPPPALDLEFELAPVLEPEPSEKLPAPTSRRPVAIAVVAIGTSLVAGAVLAGSLLAGDEPSGPPAAPAPAPAAALAIIQVVEAPPLVIRADEVPPEVRVVPLPTTVTEVAPPKARIRRPIERTARGPLAVRPSNSEISSAVVAAQKRLDACGDRHGTTGQVPVAIRVDPDGAITSVDVALGTTSFRRCVASALARQRLPATQVGTTARFPVLVR